jgi:hypothetical protein
MGYDVPLYNDKAVGLEICVRDLGEQRLWSCDLVAWKAATKNY